MGLTYEQAKSIGLGHLHPAASGGGSKERELLGRPEKRPSKPADGMNKTERAFDAMLCQARLAGLIRGWWREPTKFRLAGNTSYAPDFLVWTTPAHLNFIEIKGFMRDDAAVKLKVAADQYPCFRWLLVVRDGRHGWEVREVTRNGIARATTNVEWIRRMDA